MKSVDAELRGKKANQTEGRPFEERKAQNIVKLEGDSEKPEWDTLEEGEFSNVDMIFEQKMKSNLVTFDEDDDLCAPQENKTEKANRIASFLHTYIQTNFL